jgi:hypothetical protein
VNCLGAPGYVCNRAKNKFCDFSHTTALPHWIKVLIACSFTVLGYSLCYFFQLSPLIFSACLAAFPFSSWYYEQVAPNILSVSLCDRRRCLLNLVSVLSLCCHNIYMCVHAYAFFSLWFFNMHYIKVLTLRYILRRLSF